MDVFTWENSDYVQTVNLVPKPKGESEDQPLNRRSARGEVGASDPRTLMLASSL